MRVAVNREVLAARSVGRGPLREQVVVAERQVALQQTALDDTIIRAPFSGVEPFGQRVPICRAYVLF